MKELTYEKLLTEITTKKYNAIGPNGVDDLFKIYCAYEVESLDDICSGVDDFVAFVIKNQDSLHYDNELEKKYLVSYVLKLKEGFAFISNPNLYAYRQSQDQYAGIVCNIARKHKVKRILDVGPGEVPYSSFKIAKNLDHEIAAMDYFKIPHETIKKLNVEPYNQHLSESTDISEFELGASKRPCLGTEMFAKKCHESDIPYFIELCACNAPKQTIISWYERLKTIDKNIKFSNNEKYVFNLQMSEKSANKVFEM